MSLRYAFSGSQSALKWTKYALLHPSRLNALMVADEWLHVFIPNSRLAQRVCDEFERRFLEGN